jgi:hypothetical protein
MRSDLRVHGKPGAMEGVVFKQYRDHGPHVVDRLPRWHPGRLAALADHRLRRDAPTAASWATVAPNEHIYVYREHYETCDQFGQGCTSALENGTIHGVHNGRFTVIASKSRGREIAEKLITYDVAWIKFGDDCAVSNSVPCVSALRIRGVVAAAIDTAIAEKQEQCAKIADCEADASGSRSAKWIAAAIRGRN